MALPEDIFGMAPSMASVGGILFYVWWQEYLARMMRC